MSFTPMHHPKVTKQSDASLLKAPTAPRSIYVQVWPRTSQDFGLKYPEMDNYGHVLPTLSRSLPI